MMLKNINYPSVLKRLLLLIVPLILMPFGISCYYACNLGSDPFSIFVDGMHMIFNITHGQVTTINNIIVFVIMLIFGRKYIHIGTFLTVFITGPLIDLFRSFLMTQIVTETSTLAIKLVVLALGAVLFAIGVGLYIVVDLGIGSVDFIGVFIAEKTKFKLKWVRIVLDAFFAVVGFFMGGIVGVGTVVGVLCTGPIISFTIKLVGAKINKFAGPKNKVVEEKVEDVAEIAEIKE